MVNPAVRDDSTVDLRVADAVGRLLRTSDLHDVDVRLCPRGCHLRAATAWRTACPWCDQPLPTGDVGPYTWDTDTRCDQGSWDHRHGCGASTPPAEASVELPLTTVAAEDADGAAADLVALVRRRLDEAVAAERAEAIAALRASLARDLADALARLAAGAHADDIVSGSPETPGVYHDGCRWVAWDFEPGVVGEALVVADDPTEARRTAGIRCQRTPRRHPGVKEHHVPHEQPQAFDPRVAARWIAARTGLDPERVEVVLNAETDYLVDVLPTLADRYVVAADQNEWVASRTGMPLPFVEVVLAESMEYLVEIGVAHHRGPDGRHG